MPNVKVVIGSNFGDEGKGLMTDYFCAEASKRNESCIVALCNGGAQRGHTVVTPDGIRHVFHHFGSGTFARAATYFGEEYILNPLAFRKEYEELKALGYSPRVYSHWNCRWSTPYDMITNQILEDSRGKNRYGSCGMGIWETVLRYRNTINPSFQQFYNMTKDEQVALLKRIRDEYTSKRLLKASPEVLQQWKDILESDNLIYNFIDDVQFLHSHVVFDYGRVLKQYDNVVFENGQGLLLDQRHVQYYDNTTPSNTGIANPHIIIEKYLPNADVEVCYVTRTYMTKHGAGDFECECDKSEINAHIEDKTNITNPYQGTIRYGRLDVDGLVERIKEDIGSIDYNVSLAVTHINEFENKELLNLTELNVKYLSYEETRKLFEKILDKTKLMCYNTNNE